MRELVHDADEDAVDLQAFQLLAGFEAHIGEGALGGFAFHPVGHGRRARAPCR